MSLLNRVIYLLNMLTLFVLALSYLAPHISPSTFLWPIAFLGLLYPILLLANLLLCCIGSLLLKRYFWSNLFIILLGWGQLNALINIKGAESDMEEDFKVMSYNVRLFNVYEWIDNKDVKSDIVDFINIEQPNILCLAGVLCPK